MKRSLIAVVLVLTACGGGEKKDQGFALSDPVSVRGWVLDVKGAKRGEAMEMEVARRTQMFAASSVWVEGSEYASGGIAENGAFLILDVPPNNTIIGFNAPGAETARVVMEGIPGNADVFLPDLILEPNGAKAFDPSKLLIRAPSSDVDRPTDSGKTAKIMGYTVRIIDTPLHQMMDRREYPNPGGFRPLATVK